MKFHPQEKKFLGVAIAAHVSVSIAVGSSGIGIVWLALPRIIDSLSDSLLIIAGIWV